MIENKIISNIPVSQNFKAKPVKEKDYIMGLSPLSKKVLMPNGHGWKNFRPVGETQSKNGIDPSSCPAGGTLNCIESLGLMQYKNLGFQSDLSERYLSIAMGMSGYGGWPWDAAEKIRQSVGSIPEVYLPFDKTIDSLKKYFSPNPLSYPLFKVGVHWNKIYDFGYEWVFHAEQNLSLIQKQGLMKEALKYSPLGVAGYAWSLHSDNKYYNDGPAIHWFVVDDFKDTEYWDAYDTYPPYGKELDWNYGPAYCIRYSLTRKLGMENVVFNPNDAEDAKLDYILYLAKWFIGKIIKK